jgi:hypothetical protein
MVDTKTVIFAVILAVFVWWYWTGFSFEGFDSNTVEFVPYGCPRYGLRGDKLSLAPADRIFRGPDRHIRLSQSNGVIWEADHPPAMDGLKGCRTEQCPTNTNEFDNQDTCYKCGTWKPDPMVIPDIHPHVKN